jgi:hypothetical protein
VSSVIHWCAQLIAAPGLWAERQLSLALLCRPRAPQCRACRPSRGNTQLLAAQELLLQVAMLVDRQISSQPHSVLDY